MDRFFSWTISLSLFLCCALVLTVHRGIGFGAIPLLLASCLALAVTWRRTTPLQHEEKTFIAALCAIPLAALIAMLLNQQWKLSLLDEFSRFLLVIPIFLAIRKIGLHRDIVFCGIMIGAIGAGCFGYYQKYILGHAVAQGYLQKILFGDISLMLGFLSLSYWVGYQRKNSWLLGLGLVAFGFGGLGSICSGTRGGWIAVPFLLWLLISRTVESKRVKYTLYGTAILIGLLIYQFNDLVNHRIHNATQDFVEYFSEEEVVGHGSVASRFEMWKGALIMFTNHPFTGVGINNYTSHLIELNATKQIRLPSAAHHPHAHNDFLRLVSETGLAGGLAYILLFWLSIRFFLHLEKYDPQLATAGILLCLGFIDFSLTDALLRWNAPSTFFSVLLASFAGQLAFLKNRKSHSLIGSTGSLEEQRIG